VKAMDSMQHLKNKEILFFNPRLGSDEQSNEADELFTCPEIEQTNAKEENTWKKPLSQELFESGLRLVISFTHVSREISWHQKGDYFAIACPNGGPSNSVHVGRLSTKHLQKPFKKMKGIVSSVKFHPTKPIFFVATQKYVRIYNLVQQTLIKKLISNVQSISSFDIHPGGENVIVGSYESKVCWFDLELNVRPYKVLRYHQDGVRKVVFHQKFPLFATSSDDGTVHIFHGMVYNDLLTNALIVPVNILKGHQIVKDLGVLDCVFHPTQPWIFSAGSDSSIHLYTSN